MRLKSKTTEDKASDFLPLAKLFCSLHFHLSRFANNNFNQIICVLLVHLRLGYLFPSKMFRKLIEKR